MVLLSAACIIHFAFVYADGPDEFLHVLRIISKSNVKCHIYSKTNIYKVLATLYLQKQSCQNIYLFWQLLPK